MPLLPQPPCLLADVGDLIGLAVFIVMGILWALGQILGKVAKGGQPPVPRANLPPPGPAARPPAPRPQQVDDEIEAFLRRAAQARAGQPPAPPHPQQPPAGQPFRPPAQQVPPRPQQPPVRPPQPRQQPSRIGPPSPPRPAPPPQRGAVVPVQLVEEDSPALRTSVEQHVAQHFDTRQFEERASHLGEGVDQADERMEARIHQSLDHSLGQLGAQAPAAVSAAQQAQRTQLSSYAAAAAGLAHLLVDPQNLRQAIILNEVLRRPDFD
jgi:hypothetical protein